MQQSALSRRCAPAWHAGSIKPYLQQLSVALLTQVIRNFANRDGIGVGGPATPTSSATPVGHLKLACAITARRLGTEGSGRWGGEGSGSTCARHRRPQLTPGLSCVPAAPTAPRESRSLSDSLSARRDTYHWSQYCGHVVRVRVFVRVRGPHNGAPEPTLQVHHAVVHTQQDVLLAADGCAVLAQQRLVVERLTVSGAGACARECAGPAGCTGPTVARFES